MEARLCLRPNGLRVAKFRGARCYTAIGVVTTFSPFRFPELSQPI
jgi:hypothetical protein